MKKKILFLLLLLIPFMVRAEGEPLLKLIWEESFDSTFSETIDTGNYFIKRTTGKLVSINKNTGDTNTVEFAKYQGTYHYNYAINKDNIIIEYVDPENGNVLVGTYDLALNKKKEINLGKFDMKSFVEYNDKYFLLTGRSYSTGGYDTSIYFIDYNGNLYKQDQIKTVTETKLYYNYVTQEFILSDDNYNYFVRDYKIVPELKNADGTRVIVKNDKIQQINDDGTVIKELTLPEGTGPRVVKKGNYYYAVTVFINRVQVDEENYENYYKTKVYKIDEDLNIVGSTDIFPEEGKRAYNKNVITSLDHTYYTIGNINNEVYVIYHYNSSTPDIFKINDSLEVTTVEGINTYIYGYLTSEYILYNGYQQDKSMYHGEDYISKTEIIEYLNEHLKVKKAIVTDERLQTENIRNVRYDTNGDNHIFLVTYADSTSQYIHATQTKLKLFYFDKEENLIFSKLIYDWTPYPGGGACHYQLALNQVTTINDNITVVANNLSKNYLIVYDQEGNLIADLSDTYDGYEHLSIDKTTKYNNGLLIEFTRREGMCYYGASEYVNNPNVLGDTDYLGTQTLIRYYEYPYLVKTKIEGEGKVTAKQVRAAEGTMVEFTIEPKPGYVLGAVKVIDANGNVITFTDYKFLMPSADVTIEAIFLPINPKTGNAKILSIVALFAVSGIIYFLTKKKYGFLK